MREVKTKHLHVWTKSIDGAEYANAVYDDDVDAALAFIGLVKNITHGNVENGAVTIEDVMDSIDDGAKGMYAGFPGLVVVLSRCEGNCVSPIWN